MSRELSIDESYDWLRSTLEHLAGISSLSDDDFAYIVFEVLDVDVRSALSEVALDRLVFAEAISDSAKGAILKLRSMFLSLVDSAPRAEAVGQIRRDDRWLDVARSSARILLQYVHDDVA
jgi:hypothetical protein